jgi:sortase A
MDLKRSPDDLSIRDLERLLYRKKRSRRIRRLSRLRTDGREVEASGFAPYKTGFPESSQRRIEETEQFFEAQRLTESVIPLELTDITKHPTNNPLSSWRRFTSRALLFVEIIVVIGLLAVGISLWSTRTELNQELAQMFRAQSQSYTFPTPISRPEIDVVILPGGHKPPVDGQISEPGEAGDIPEHLLPVINEFTLPPVPTPAPEHARRLQIPAIDVDSPIVQGMYDWDQLKKGVAQRIGSAGPGQIGNMSLAGHNDIYGEVFRHLDKLSPGDEIIVTTQRQSYTYVVRESIVVDPTEVWVLEPTDFASTTLISCYPYRVNTKRIAVFADLAIS